MDEKQRKNQKIYHMVTCALMAAVLCVLCPMTVQIGAIPISLINFVVFLTVILLGGKWAFVSYTVFFLLGAAGLPVFSGYSGGLAKIAGPTGGYLVGYFLLIPIAGLFLRHGKGKIRYLISGAGMVLGMLVVYLLGTVWYMVLTQCTASYAIATCVAPFALLDLGKLVVALIVGNLIRDRLIRARLIGS